MKLTIPSKCISQFPDLTLIERSVNELNSLPGSFLILEKTEMTYVQILNTEHGFIGQFQNGSIQSHFEFDNYLSRPQVISLLKAYAQYEKDWDQGLPYHKVNVLGLWGKFGYIVGQLCGKLIRPFS